MGLDKIVGKAKDLANDPKVKNALGSEKAERASDAVLDKAAGAVDRVTGGKHSDTVRKARDAADRAVGTDSGNVGEQRPGHAREPGRGPGEGRFDGPGAGR
ncbi:antitoxin [Sediminivirga luteola]|uniref:antitoxin n=1 Tax=Sediminivirga luteola TaxID=1774748 RepID=UPI001F5734C2|nr:antitoxin [Sediminivirga luteola]MCI2265443.1 antitoxin [Sediminivirga luteola]